VLSEARAHARPLARYLVLMAVAGVIAGFGVIDRNEILIVGAMAVSPDLLPLCAACVGIEARRPQLAARALGTLLIGLGVACVVAAAGTLLLVTVGWLDEDFRLGGGGIGTLARIDLSTIVVAAARPRSPYSGCARRPGRRHPLGAATRKPGSSGSFHPAPTPTKGTPGMANLVAIAYDDLGKAQEVMGTVGQLVREHSLTLEDAVIVEQKQDGKIKLHQPSLAGRGATGGALWGGLIGLIFFMPLLGLAVGAASGAAAGALSDYGIDDNFMKELGDKLQPGNAAVFVLVKEATRDKVVPEIAKYGGTVVQSSLSNEQEAALQEALDKGAAPAAQA
jgi:uncharacterized membrane protein